jgi:hypothetical protein
MVKVVITPNTQILRTHALPWERNRSRLDFWAWTGLGIVPDFSLPLSTGLPPKRKVKDNRHP